MDVENRERITMSVSTQVHKLLERMATVLPVSHEDIIYRGIAVEVADRIMALKKAGARLRARYGSLEELEQRIQAEGISPDDHTLYEDLLEWRAINHELAELLHMFEAL